MENASVISLRDKIRNGKDVSLVIVTDNMEIFDESSDVVIWDDAAGCIYSAYSNNDHFTNMKEPVQFKATTYEHIQYIKLVLNSEAALSLVNVLAEGNTIYREGSVKMLFASLSKDPKSYL